MDGHVRISGQQADAPEQLVHGKQHKDLLLHFDRQDAEAILRA
jgi:hypothetical protein